MTDLAEAGHPVWLEVAPVFLRDEFNNPDAMSSAFLRKLHIARLHSKRLTSALMGHENGIPFRIVSDARDPGRNEAAGGVKASAHTERPCAAVDLRVLNSLERAIVLESLRVAGLGDRIGLEPPTKSQRERFGPTSGTVHVDDSPTLPRPRVWSNWK